MTSVKSQGDAGICWAYALSGYVEALYLFRTGKQVDISEEALAWHHFGNVIASAIEKAQTSEELEQKLSQKLDKGCALGKFPDAPLVNALLKYEPEHPSVLELAEEHGLVPESAYRFKFQGTPMHQSPVWFLGLNPALSQAESAKSAIRNRAILLLKKLGLEELQKRLKSNRRGLFTDILSPNTSLYSETQGWLGFISAPPTTFTVETENGNLDVTPQSYLREHLGISLGSSRFIVIAHPHSLDPFLNLIKAYLTVGMPVLFSYKTNSVLRVGADYKGPQSLSKPIEQGLIDEGWKGGHAVLLTDYINRNDQSKGSFTDAERCDALRMDPKELWALVFKNSWGTRVGTAVRGEDTSSSDSRGYFSMERTYIEEALNYNLKRIDQRSLNSYTILTFTIVIPMTANPWADGVTPAPSFLTRAPQSCKQLVSEHLRSAFAALKRNAADFKKQYGP